MNMKLGQIYRDQDGANWKLVAFSRRGWPLVRNPNGKGHAIETNPAWLNIWTLTKERAMTTQEIGKMRRTIRAMDLPTLEKEWAFAHSFWASAHGSGEEAGPHERVWLAQIKAERRRRGIA